MKNMKLFFFSSFFFSALFSVLSVSSKVKATLKTRTGGLSSTMFERGAAFTSACFSRILFLFFFLVPCVFFSFSFVHLYCIFLMFCLPPFCQFLPDSFNMLCEVVPHVRGTHDLCLLLIALLGIREVAFRCRRDTFLIYSHLSRRADLVGRKATWNRSKAFLLTSKPDFFFFISRFVLERHAQQSEKGGD